MKKDLLTAYARTLLVEGVNLQINQPLLINGEVDNADFIRLLTEEAYKLGAREVTINWRDSFITREKFLYGADDIFETVKSWVPEYYHNQLDSDTAIISLVSADPEQMKGVDPKRLAASSKASGKALSFWQNAVMSSTLRWCVAAVPSLTWARLLELKGTDEEQLDELWKIILRFARIVDVPEDEKMKPHLDRLAHRTEVLNHMHIASLHYVDGKGTDLTIEMSDKAIWMGGREEAENGLIFNANIPTEEVFSAPLRTGVNGTVRNTKPLSYQGHTIDGFTLVFKEGRVVDFTAREGGELLKTLLETDEGSSMLGEVALVDHHSPISLSGKIFYETLFDENASCHLAFGAAYPTCVKGTDGKSEDELKAMGVNQSMKHVDFMIGSEDLDITATTYGGETVEIMKKGRLLI